MPKVRWVMSYGFCSKFYTLSALRKFWKSVKIWQSYRQLNGGSFFETQCSSEIQTNTMPKLFNWLFFQTGPLTDPWTFFGKVLLPESEGQTKPWTGVFCRVDDVLKLLLNENKNKAAGKPANSEQRGKGVDQRLGIVNRPEDPQHRVSDVFSLGVLCYLFTFLSRVCLSCFFHVIGSGFTVSLRHFQPKMEHFELRPTTFTYELT